ncbi:glycosyltransferase [Roseobacter sp. YSTF-M11]|uniref:Glycosyltransferase n=1 Tax=Roseobacter insulae TaxID=2859783 RepID=A0A9X1K0Q3_9RHOB|nr:glycosyltransferase [Roseobacter insulae]MBW4710791.1 glycosyltransferase [Roseobacter insulae]
MSVGAIIIGRNEGDRLIRGLAALGEDVSPVIYVDSGSDDGSVAAAEAAGAQVVLLDTDRPFTAARARNAGIQALVAQTPPPDLVQFIDGDCELRAGWIETATGFLADHPKVAAVCGRRRERFPEASVYNRLIDLEWDTPCGETRACGGDVLMRLSALRQVGGYNPDLIAGEEPELCVRLRKAGWQIWRLEAEMTWHDAALTRFSQWWKRARRAGHAYAEGAALHGAPPERHNVAQTRRALIWGMALPLAVAAGVLVTPWALPLVLLWPLQWGRLTQRSGDPVQALFLTLSKTPEALGVLEFHMHRLRGRKAALIEYK